MNTKINWTELTNQFNHLPAGSLYKGNDNSYYIKPTQSQAHHLEGMLINLFTGSIVHFSNLYGLHKVGIKDICWDQKGEII